MVRKMEMEEQLKDVIGAARKHWEKLRQMQNLQSYFQENRDLIAWIKRLQHTITRYHLVFFYFLYYQETGSRMAVATSCGF